MVNENKQNVEELSAREIGRLKRIVRAKQGNMKGTASIIGIHPRTLERICATGKALPENVQKIRDKVLNPSKEVA